MIIKIRIGIRIVLIVFKVSSYTWCLFIAATLWKLYLGLYFTEKRTERETVYTPCPGSHKQITYENKTWIQVLLNSSADSGFFSLICQQHLPIHNFPFTYHLYWSSAWQ